MTVSSEQEAVERAVASYERAGYTVQRDVALSSLDTRLPVNVRVDFVASRSDELVLVEVKSRASASDAPLLQVSAAARLLRNARAELVWAGEVVPVPDSSTILAYSARAQDVYLRDATAGLLLAWAALEGGIDRVSLSQDLEPQVSTRQTLTNLYGNRIISWSAYSRLMKLSRTKDAVVHTQRGEIGRDDFADIQAYSNFFGDPQFIPYDAALEIARDLLTAQQAAELLPTWSEHEFYSTAAHRLRQALPQAMLHTDVGELLTELATGNTGGDIGGGPIDHRAVTAEVRVNLTSTATAITRQTSHPSQSYGSKERTTGSLAVMLDEAYEGKSIAEIADAPVEALQGVSVGDAKHLLDALNIRTVRDLGTNKYFLWAQSIAKIAE